VLVEESGLPASEVAERFDLRVADVYAALTYYHDHPEKMREVERRRERAIADHEHLTTDPETVRD
jgi:hypothetical protein